MSYCYADLISEKYITYYQTHDIKKLIYGWTILYEAIILFVNADKNR